MDLDRENLSRFYPNLKTHIIELILEADVIMKLFFYLNENEKKIFTDILKNKEIIDLLKMRIDL